jgi:hypothetical protein
MIHLEKIDAGNVWDIVDLKVAESQEDFVAPNEAIIIEAYTTGPKATIQKTNHQKPSDSPLSYTPFPTDQ